MWSTGAEGERQAGAVDEARRRREEAARGVDETRRVEKAPKVRRP
jgi:hypothetical protein